MRNIYESKHAKKFILLPIVLVLLSLFLAFVFPGVEKGTDFKGGLLFSIQTQQPLPDGYGAKLEDSLKSFSTSVSVKTINEKHFEVELGLNENLEKLNALSLQMVSKDDALRQAELNASLLKDIDPQGESIAIADSQKLKGEVNLLATQIFDGIGRKPPLPRDAHDFALKAKIALDDEKQALKDDIVSAIGSIVKIESVSMKEVGALLSQQFFSKIVGIFLFSFVAAAVLIFILFRSFVPALAVLFGAFADIAMTLGAMSIFSIPLTLASFAALLMLIGFSLDTDVMLTMRVLKRSEGSAKERAFDSMKTGVLMSVCAIIAFSVLFAAASFLQISVFLEIASVVIIGSFADLIATWLFNAPIVLNYFESKERKISGYNRT